MILGARVDNPLPHNLVWLNLALPGVWLAGRAIGRRVGGDAAAGRVLAPGIGLATWLIAVHATARFLGDFSAGMVVGTLAVAAAGLASLADPGSRGARRGGEPGRGGVGMLAGALVATVAIAPTALGWSFHDEVLYTGHLSIAAQIQNGPYPPRHLTFPEFELRYHYGFDVLVAAITGLLRLDLSPAIDLATLACWAYAWCLLYQIGERAVGRGWGTLAAFLTLFGGGLSLIGPADCPYTLRAISMCVVGGLMNPPLVSYFFQHPWSLGLPLGLCALLVLLDRERLGDPRRLATLGILLVALSLTQFVLFLALGGIVAVVVPLAVGSRPWPWRVAATLAMLAIAVVGAWSLGGFFAPAPDRQALAIVPRLGIAPTLSGTIGWHLETFGLLLPLGLLGLGWLHRGRLALGLLAAGGLIVPNAFKYQHSWDIQKFATLAAVALSLSATAAIARAFALRTKAPGRVVGVLLLIGATASGLAFPIAFTLRLPDIPRYIYPEEPARLSRADAQAIGWLRRRVAPGEVMYRSPAVSPGYAQFGGLAQPWLDDMVATFGFSRSRRLARLQLLKDSPPDPEPYLQQGIRWFVLNVDEAGDPLLRVAAAWLRTGRAEEVERFGPLRILRLADAPTSGRPAVGGVQRNSSP